MAYSVVRLDNLQGTLDGTKLVSFRYYVSTTATACENGWIVGLDSLIDGEREVWKAVAPTANQDLGKLVLVATPELIYDNRNYRNLTDFRNEAGEDCRGYILQHGDIFSVTVDAFASDTAPTSTNKYITIANAVQSLTAGSSSSNARAEYLGSETVGNLTFYTLRVI